MGSKAQELLGQGHTELFAFLAEQPLVARRKHGTITALEDNVYFVRSGWVGRFQTLSDRRRQIIDIFLPGDFVGLGVIFLPDTPSALQPLNDVELAKVNAASLFDLAISNAAVATRLMWHLVVQEQRLQQRVVRLGRCDAAEKTAATLLEFYGRLRRAGMIKAQAYNLPLTQHELADYLGMTVVHTNRILKRLRYHRIANVQKNFVTIHDLTRLNEIAAGYPLGEEGE
jgi:CRP/FNR family transcriptional regulator